MRTKEAIKGPKEPTADELERGLAGIEEATLEEELERKRRGLTLEPEAKRIEKKPSSEVWETEKVERAEAEKAEEEIKGKNVEDYVKKWVKSRGPHPKLKEIEYLIGSVEFSGDTSIPLSLVDEILGKARKKDEEEYGGSLDISGILEDAVKIRVLAYKKEQFFEIQIFAGDGGLTKILVECNGKIKNISKSFV